MTRDKGNLPVSLQGEILPPDVQRSGPVAVYPQAALSDTAMRGVVALFYRWGFTHIARAIDAQTAVEESMIRLNAARRGLAEAEGRSLALPEIRRNAYQNELARLDADRERRERQRHEHEMSAIDRQIELAAKKRELRVAEEVDKRRSVARVASAKKDAVIARRELEAAQRISKTDIETIVLDKLRARHYALEREAEAHARAQIADAARCLKDAFDADTDSVQEPTATQLDAFFAEFQAIQTVRGGLSAEIKDSLDQLHAFMRGRLQP